MYNGTKVIDCHGHMTTPTEVSGHLNGLMMQRRPSPGRSRTLTCSDERMEEAQQGHLKFLDQYNIDFQLISPRPASMFHWETDYVQERWCWSTNDIIKRIVDLHPDRYAGVGQLPQNGYKSTSFCVDEFERCMDMGFVGMTINPDPSSYNDYPGLHHEWWYPVYEAAVKHDVPLFIHPSSVRWPQVAAVMNNYQVGNIVGEFMATITLEHSDVFDDFPKLRVMCSHLGGAFNRFLINDEYHFYGDRPMGDNLTFDCCAHNADFIQLGIKQKGVDRVLFGTEAPGAGSHVTRPSDDPYAPGHTADDLVPIIANAPYLSEEDKIKIFNKNPLRIFSKLNESKMGKVGDITPQKFADNGYVDHGKPVKIKEYEHPEGLRL
jgi:predicted TIM-barrel fold metal-dependent hydrolase